MMRITAVDAVGEQQFTVHASTPEDIAANITSPLQGVIFPPPSPTAWWDFTTHLWVERPAQPTAVHTWDPVLKQWGDPRSLAEAQDQAWQRMKVARERAAAAPFTSMGMVFDYSPMQINGAFSAAKAAFDAGQDFSVTWTLADNSFVTLSAPQMIQVGLDLVAHVNAAHEHARTKRTAIYAATSIPEVEAIEW